MRSELLPDRIVSLPGGLVADGGRLLQTAVLCPLSGREEEWLAQHRGVPSAVRVTQLLSACLRSLGDRPASEDLVGRLLVADRDYLVLQLRRLTLGDTVLAVLICPACDSKMDVSFRTSDVPVEFRTQNNASYTLQLAEPGRQRAVRFRLLTGGDQGAVLGMDMDVAVNTLLDRCLLDDGGEALSAAERNQVIDAMEKLAPTVELDLDLTCPDCGHQFATLFDTTAFFLDEMSVNGDQLLREVHALALYYHWSESEILGLGRDRRRAYLDLVSESLRLD